jgi:hypothetical protein
MENEHLEMGMDEETYELFLGKSELKRLEMLAEHPELEDYYLTHACEHDGLHGRRS